MAWHICIWDDLAREKLAAHDVTPEEFEQVLAWPHETVESRSSGRTAVIGFTDTGRKLFCVYDKIDETYVDPFTAYEID